ncbi:NAD-binding of NADP-dependent 3-hydroxyisobutyrate dehydrogenase-domain-containing protein [Aspergillus venezuelensis]
MGSLGQTNIGFIGLGAMGLGMASDLQRRGQYSVTGFDIWQPSVEKFVASGGRAGSSPRDVAQTSQFLICMAATAEQLNTILFDHKSGAIEGLPRDATIILCSTVPPTYYDTLPSRISSLGRPGVLVVDAPVSGGTLRAANGTLSIFAAGCPEALSRVRDLLKDMSGQLYIISGGLGAGSKIKMVNQLLVGTHIAAACEAIAFAIKAGLDKREVFEILQQTSGSSWAWDNRVPHILDSDWTPLSALNIFVKDKGIAVSTSRAVQFPLPIASVAEQLYISGSAQGYGKEDDAGLVRLFLPGHDVAAAGQRAQNEDRPIPIASSQPRSSGISRVALVGLDDMACKMALSLADAGYGIHISYPPGQTLPKLLSNNRNISAHDTLIRAATDADILVLCDQKQGEPKDLLLGTQRLAEVLANDAVILLSSTASPTFVRSLEKLLANLNRGISLIDAPICSGGSEDAPCVTMLYSGSDHAISKIYPILSALESSVFNSIRRVTGTTGSASTVKLIDQHLSAIQLLSASKALSFAAKLDLDTRQIYQFIGSAAAWSWMLQTRAPRMLIGDWDSVAQADSNSGSVTIGTFADDLGVFLDEAKSAMYWAPLASAAYNAFLVGVSKEWGAQCDASVVRLYESEGVSVARSASAGS